MVTIQFGRSFSTPHAVKNAIKSAKTLTIEVRNLTALGRWRSLHPNADGEYQDYEGPFSVKQGVGPAFIRDDGTECFMVDDTARVGVVFEVDP